MLQKITLLFSLAILTLAACSTNQADKSRGDAPATGFSLQQLAKDTHLNAQVWPMSPHLFHWIRGKSVLCLSVLCACWHGWPHAGSGADASPA